MKVLVTGGCGYISSHLPGTADRAAGMEARGGGQPLQQQGGRLARIAAISGRRPVSTGDIRDPACWIIFSEQHIDAVITSPPSGGRRST